MQDVNRLGERLVQEEHPEEEQVRRRLEEMLTAWERLKALSVKRQERCEDTIKHVQFCAILLGFEKISGFVI